MDVKNSPSGPLATYTLLNQSGTAPALAGAGSNATFTIAYSPAVVGDIGIVVCPTLAAAGVIVNFAKCLAAGVITLNITGTKAYAGGALTDVSLNMHRA